MVLQAIQGSSPNGLSHEQIRKAYAESTGHPIAYTTLRARLDELLAAGKVIRSAKRRNPRYSTPPSTANAPINDAAAEPSTPHGASSSTIQAQPIPLSAEAKRVRALLHRPRAERTPVTYDIEFLDGYTPGTTWYLPAAERARLRELGSTTYAGQPAGTYARDIMQRLVIDLSWGSSRLEGLRYSRIDTEELLRNGTLPAGVSHRDRQLILNHKSAIEFLVEDAQSIGFNRQTILTLHALLAENLLHDRDDEGALRGRPIGIGTSVYTPIAIPQVIEAQLESMLLKADAIPDAIEQALFVMVHLPYLQPFIDVNKRTSRLAANISLIRANLCPLSFVDVPEDVYADGTLGVYELTDVSLLRDVFVWAYERSCSQFKVLRESMGEPNPIRLNYRQELRTIVADTVRDMVWPTDTELDARAQQLGIPGIDIARVVAELQRDLQSLRPEILARYSLRQSEYARWVTAVGPSRMPTGPTA
ncbi:MAG: fic/DOC family protein [Gemmatimonadetes bacterium]|nr:fic/DOC family protein [Gemmatimonadota bacterium]